MLLPPQKSDTLIMSMPQTMNLETMAEVLQTHRQGVVRTLPRPLTYKKAPKTLFRTHYSRLQEPTNMEYPAQDLIERIIDRAHSLDDLSADDVLEIRCLSEQSIIINKFKVTFAQYCDWLDRIGDDIRGVEYDAQNACIIVKGGPGWMREAATWLIGTRLLGELEDRLSAATGSPYDLTGSIGKYRLNI